MTAGGLKVDGGRFQPLAQRRRARRRALERRGYDGCWTAEINHDPFLPLLLAAEHTTRIELGTSIAVAFARNPMTVANIGWDLQAYSEGRFILGLGSQINRTSRSASACRGAAGATDARVRAGDARDLGVLAGRDEARFDGEFYTHNLMTPMFTPERTPHGFPKVFIAAVGEAMTEMCGEVADGLLAHAFTTKRYSEEMTMPALTRGHAAGRPRSARLPGVVSAVRGDGRRRGRAGRRRRRHPQADRVLRLDTRLPQGARAARLGDLHTELHRLSRAGDWDAMGSLIDDEILDEFAVVAPLDQVAAKSRPLRRRDRPGPGGLSASVDEATVDAIVKELRDDSEQRGNSYEHADHGRSREGIRRPEGVRRRDETPRGADASAGQRSGVMGRRAGYRPFWAITKHADIMEIERANDALHQLAAAGAVDRRGRRAAGRASASAR